MPGKTITLYIMDADRKHLKSAELSQWTGIAYIGDHKHLGIIKNMEELAYPAVYFLFGDNEEDSRMDLYIGEADEAGRRIYDHRTKDRWERFIVFLSKDANMTKAHVKHLEQQMYLLAEKNVTTINLQNKNKPGGAKLPQSALDEMTVYSENMVFMLKNLGLIDFSTTNPDRPVAVSDETQFVLPLTGDRLDDHGKNLTARMQITQDGYRLLKGSYLEGVMRQSFEKHHYYKLRQRIVQLDVMAKSDYEDVLLLKEDIDFSSPSAAAAVVKNRAINGRKEWKTREGVTLEDFESKE